MRILFIILIIVAGMAFIPAANQNTKPKPFEPLKNFVLVNSGYVKIERDSFSVNAFYICSTEISNAEYRYFLNDLLKKGENAKYQTALYDSTGWNPDLGIMKYYHSHPAYKKYPVINISYEGAMLYCKWLQEKINESNKLPYKVIVRLPLKAEWIMAARGEDKYSLYSCGNFLFDNKGQKLCNFFDIKNESIQFDTSSGEYIANKNDIYLAYKPYISFPNFCQLYKANDFGLYNMSGNVAEMLNDKGLAIGGSYLSPGYDVRVTSIKKFNLSCDEVGFRPVFSVVPENMRN